ncbi:MAG: hypothetical protein PHP08_00880 [Candidatus Dojkabacteria bacterium]|nr:hypothetical protein [Candidatus Dojkabacteria bacterium]
MAKIIHWRSKVTGATGCGSVEFPDEQAEEIVKKFNNKNPVLHHWTEDAKEE